MALQIEFGGFYQSHWDDILSHVADEDLFEMGEDEELPRKMVDWQKTFAKASEQIVKCFEQLLSNNQINVNLKFQELVSPREYNFETDIILVSNDNHSELIESVKLYIDEHNLIEDYEELRMNKTTSRSGYYAFYNAEDLTDKQNLELMIETIFNDDKSLQLMLEYFETEAFSMITYQDED